MTTTNTNSPTRITLRDLTPGTTGVLTNSEMRQVQGGITGRSGRCVHVGRKISKSTVFSPGAIVPGLTSRTSRRW